MNIDNMNRVIAFLEDGAPHIKIDMQVGVVITRTAAHDALPESDCDTAACLAGICTLLALDDETKAEKLEEWHTDDKDVSDWDFILETALEFLDLKPRPLSGVFGHPLFDPRKAPANPTPAETIQALRNARYLDRPWEPVINARYSDREEASRFME